tara:strand:+ start:27977 stop:28081 length:105 start_codon:yes stop_codon:yes gene_type:complete
MTYKAKTKNIEKLRIFLKKIKNNKTKKETNGNSI